MEIPADVKLRPLDDADLATRDPAEDIRGRVVVDAAGDELGKVDELLVDDAEQHVRFVRIAWGGVLGIGKKRFLVPVEAISSIDEDQVRLGQARERIEGGPPYDPEIVEKEDYATIYNYYGYAPFWGPGYVPPYPGAGLR